MAIIVHPFGNGLGMRVVWLPAALTFAPSEVK